MAEFYFTVFLTVLNIALPYGITRWDRARLGDEQLARAWNGPSWACAICFFGPLSLPAHFWVTRRKVGALFFGVFCTIAIFALQWLLGELVERLVG